MKPLFGLFLPSILCVLVLAGCSSENAPGEPASCNDLVHDGSTHTVALASNPPTPSLGGTISDGNYVLTSARLFNVPREVDITRQIGASLEIRGGVMEQVTQLDGKLERTTFKYTVAGTMLSVTDSCPASAATSYGFTATATGIEIFVPEPGTVYTLQQIFTKR